MTAVHHVGVTVPNLQEAVTFFCRGFGASIQHWEGPVCDAKTDWMSQQLNVDADAELTAAMLKLPPTFRLELFEYKAAGQRTKWPRNSDYGAVHLGIEVEDIEEAVRRLNDIPGARVLGEIQTETAPEQAGTKWIYFLTPWGMQMELVMPPPREPAAFDWVRELAPW
jgi:catechol 2,3-dioxygenase-like lactoylglutathione lyase family enzyme